MAKCKHKRTKQTVMREQNEIGQVVPFIRITCVNCGRWVSDQPRRGSRCKLTKRNLVVNTLQGLELKPFLSETDKRKLKKMLDKLARDYRENMEKVRKLKRRGIRRIPGLRIR